MQFFNLHSFHIFWFLNYYNYEVKYWRRSSHYLFNNLLIRIYFTTWFHLIHNVDKLWDIISYEKCLPQRRKLDLIHFLISLMVLLKNVPCFFDFCNLWDFLTIISINTLLNIKQIFTILLEKRHLTSGYSH